jgi:serine/threonine protein kinase
MELSEGLIIADRFRLIRPLGQGGMGAVWLALHTGLDVPCAVKFIHDEAAKSPELRARFEREAKAAAQLRSPHVVQVLDHGVWEGAPYIAMELLEGEDLAHRLHRRRPLSARETLLIAVHVGRALTRAHAAGLVHRDLKPANIFLVRDDEQEIAKVLDFGVAKVKETSLDGATKTGAVLGTPFYMSPEQARGIKSIDHRSDLWALAVVVYQCLVGKLPFRGDALGDLFVKIIVEPVPVPSQVAAQIAAQTPSKMDVAPIPPGFDAWWARATCRDPADRYQTAKAFTDALGLALGVTVPETVDGGAVTRDLEPARPLSQSGTVALSDPDAAGLHESAENDAPTRALSRWGRERPQTPGPLRGALPAREAPAAPASLAMPSTPMQQSLSVGPGAAPRARQLGLMAAVVAGAVAVGSLGTFLAVRSSGPAAPHPAAAVSAALPGPPAPTAGAPTAPVAAALVTGASSASTPPASSASVAPAAPAASSTHGPAVTRPHPTRTTPASPEKTDFGF